MSLEVLDRHWQYILQREGVLNVALANKFKGGIDTGIKAIVVYLRRKRPAVELALENLIPVEIEGVPTDVVEIAPVTWQADKTGISQLHPQEQLRRLGLQYRDWIRVQKPRGTYKTPIGQSDLIKWASSIQNQKNCGACTSFGNIGVGEACFRILWKDPNNTLKLSEAYAFFCSGGTCSGGNTPDAVLNQFLKGVCTEECLPYVDQDQSCGQGICQNWWLQARKLASWDIVMDLTEQKSLLDQKPLNATMAVHQSLLNYAGGIYKNLGDIDPVVGYHDIGCFGYNDAQSYHIIRNSWDITWGQNCVVNGIARPGYCMIAYGELDQEMQELIPSNAPVAKPRHCRVMDFLKNLFKPDVSKEVAYACLVKR